MVSKGQEPLKKEKGERKRDFLKEGLFIESNLLSVGSGGGKRNSLSGSPRREPGVGGDHKKKIVRIFGLFHFPHGDSELKERRVKGKRGEKAKAD